MNIRFLFTTLVVLLASKQASALALAPEEFHASRLMACVLAEQSLGRLSAEQYGERAHAVLDGFDEAERNSILAKALGYYDGLMFSIAADDREQVKDRLEAFVFSSSCQQDGYRNVTLHL